MSHGLLCITCRKKTPNSKFLEEENQSTSGISWVAQTHALNSFRRSHYLSDQHDQILNALWVFKKWMTIQDNPPRCGLFSQQPPYVDQSVVEGLKILCCLPSLALLLLPASGRLRLRPSATARPLTPQPSGVLPAEGVFSLNNTDMSQNTVSLFPFWQDYTQNIDLHILGLKQQDRMCSLWHWYVHWHLLTDTMIDCQSLLEYGSNEHKY